MDELSWRARLAKSNINILNITWSSNRESADVFYEFMYHPKYGQTKWCKTVTPVESEEVEISEGVWERFMLTGEEIADALSKEVLSLRKELEG